MAPDLIRKVIGDRNLQKMPGNTLVAEDRARILNCCSNIEVAALGVVRRDVVEARRVPIVEPGWIHEATRRGRFERLGELADLKRTDVSGDRNQLMCL